MIIIAQIQNATPDHLYQWVLICAGFIIIINQATQMIKGWGKADPSPPLHTQFANRAETQAQFLVLEGKIELVGRENRAQHADLIRAGEGRSKVLHDRINDVLRAVAKLEGKIEGRGRTSAS